MRDYTLRYNTPYKPLQPNDYFKSPIEIFQPQTTQTGTTPDNTCGWSYNNPNYKEGR